MCEPHLIFAYDEKDWEENEKKNTLFTEERFIPKILVECDVAKSINEVRKNKSDLVKTLDKVDFHQIKWGKKSIPTSYWI